MGLSHPPPKLKKQTHLKKTLSEKRNFKQYTFERYTFKTYSVIYHTFKKYIFGEKKLQEINWTGHLIKFQIFNFISMHLCCCTDANALMIRMMMVVGMLGMVGVLVVVVVDQDLYLDQLANLSSAFCSSLNCHWNCKSLKVQFSQFKFDNS